MANLDKLVDELSALTVLEAADLSKKLEEKWGVSAAAPVAVAAAPAAGAAEEQTEFTVILTAGFFQLLLDLFRFLLGDVLLHVLRRAFDEVLGFLQAQVGADGADFLDDVDLLVAAGGQHDGEFGLLFDSFRRGGAAASRHGGHRHRRGGRDAPLFFKLLGELGGLHDGQGGQVFDELVEVGHGSGS